MIRDFFVVAIFTTCLPAAAIAASPAESPPNPHVVTDIYVDVYGIQMFNIDAQSETFEVEARMEASWYDERLAFNAELEGMDTRVLEGDAATEALKSGVWSPSFEIVDARAARNTLQVALTINSDGYVVYNERFIVLVTQRYDLTNFPFDIHDISFSIQPYTYDAYSVQFHRADELQGTLKEKPEGWEVSDPALVISNGYCSNDEYTVCSIDDDCAGDDSVCELEFADATVKFKIERYPEHYLTNYILPMILIVLISSAVFSMGFETMHLGDRLGVSFTTVLTIVAFDFVISGNLPNLWYSTALDNVLTTSYVFLALSVIENVFAARVHSGRPQSAARLDTIFRWGFPLAYLLTVFFIIGAAMPE